MNRTMNIEVLPYDPEWPELYASEKEVLLGKFGRIVENIYHIGSTAVEGLAAKPIIDILLETNSLEKLDGLDDEFESLAYEAMGEFGIPGRRYFRKGGIERTHQIHAFASGSHHITRHLAFRNYLREMPEIRKEYEGLKTRVALECNHEIDKYCKCKHAFIQEHERNALDWIQDRN